MEDVYLIVEKLLQKEVIDKIKMVEVSYQVHYVPKTYSSESVLKPVLRIEFKDGKKESGEIN